MGSVNILTTFTLEEIFPDSSHFGRIRFAVYTQMGESEIKTSRFSRDSGEFESEIYSEYFVSDYC